MEKNYTIQKVRKQGKQKIITIPAKDKELSPGTFVIVSKLNINTSEARFETSTPEVVLLQNNGKNTS